MARFVCRNYGPSRQISHEGNAICLSHDQVIETDDAEEASVIGAEDLITVTDRGEQFATPPVPPEEPAKKRKVTVDNVEAVHREKFPDADEPKKTVSKPPPEAKTDADEIAYSDMTVKELQVLAKDRTIKTSGLLKDELIKALIAYDAEG